MLKAGDADSISLPFNHKDDIRSGGNLLPGIQEFSGDTFVVQFLGFNRAMNMTAVPPGDTDVPSTFFADINLRKAFSYAWPYTDFINNVVYGYGTPICGPIPKGMFGYDASTPCYSYDLNLAKQYLQAATDPRAGHTGSYWDNGFTLTIYYNIGNTVREEGARDLQTAIQSLNSQRTGLPPFTIKVQGLEWATFLQRVNQKAAPLFFLGWAPDYADADDYVGPFLHTGTYFAPRVGYSNTTNDALIEQQAMQQNATQRLALLKTIQAAPYYDVPYIWLYQAKSNDIFRTWVTGFYNNPMYSGNYYYVLSK
jgi:peptide/nickel transport system substrate-binding protein